jgi:hypothetical protein
MGNFGKEMKNGAICSAKIGACAFVIYGALTVINTILGAGSKEEVKTEPEVKQSGEQPLESAAK